MFPFDAVKCGEKPRIPCRIAIVTLLLVLLQSPVKAQWNNLTAPEKAQLLSLPTIRQQVDTLNEWAYNDGGRAIARYAAAALELAEKNDDRMGISDAHIQLGSAEEEGGRYTMATQHFEAALRERLILKHPIKTASAYNRLSQIKTKEGQYGKAIDWAKKGLAIMANQPPHVNTAYLYEAWGNAARLAGKYAEVDSAFHLGLHLYGKLTEAAMGLASMRMSHAAFLQECRYRYPAAKDSLRKSLQTFTSLGRHAEAGKCLLLLGNNAYYTRQLDSAMAYYAQGIQMQTQLEQVDYFLLLENRGRVSMEQGHYKPAYRDIQSALHFFGAQQDTVNWSGALFEMGNWFYEQNQLDSAVVYYQQAASLPGQDPMQRGRLLFFWSDALSQMGRHAEAEQYTNAYLALLSGLNAPQTQGAFEALNRQQLDKNRLLKRLAQQDKEKAERMFFGGSGLLLLLLLLALLAVRNNRQKRRLAEATAQNAQQSATIAAQAAEQAEKEKEIALQNEQIAKQRETIAIQEKLELIQYKEMETHYARLEAQDELQKQIGRELHDGVGAMLTAVKLNLSPVDEVLDRFPSEKQAQFSEANRLLDEACQELRRVSHELGSVILTHFGLKAQLEAFANILRNSGKYEVELDLHALEGRFDKKIEVNLYRIVQELVSNTIKHAQADKISISANHFENMVNIIVEDNGKGFDEAKALEKPGMGFISLQARVHDMKGQLFIDTRIGRGTVVSIDVPLFPQSI